MVEIENLPIEVSSVEAWAITERGPIRYVTIDNVNRNLIILPIGFYSKLIKFWILRFIFIINISQFKQFSR